MVKEGELKYLFPEDENSPNQAYIPDEALERMDLEESDPRNTRRDLPFNPSQAIQCS